MTNDKHAEIAEGFAVAQAAIMAVLEDDDAAALRAINEASHAELAWAAARMMGIVQSVAVQLAGSKPAAKELMADAFTEDDDLITTQMRVMTQDSEE